MNHHTDTGLVLNDRQHAAFRHRAQLPHPLSLRNDKPHVWFFEGYWRVSLWNRRHRDLAGWEAVHKAVNKANAELDQLRHGK